MIKYLLSCLLLFATLAGMCQKKKSVVNLLSSDRTIGTNSNDVLKVYNGTFQQESSVLRSDSAYFYPKRNSFDAYGHVRITQGDTLNIYSDKLNYNGNTHIALLTDNVRMVDKDATLTTNFLTYNTATRIGTYTGGGKLVNKDNTLTSTNGYYFAFTRDSYFRYNVVLNTVDAIIKTDTLRYNTGSRISYFYGPTHIYGKKNKDTLYTENGTYNTVTEQAFFGKKNLYTQGTKSLKGDSLFYDRLKGYGRAVKHVVFNDNEQKITLNGDLGTYFQTEERTVVTRDPWVTIVTEDKDSTKTDTTARKTEAATKQKGKTAVKPVPNTQPVNTANLKNAQNAITTAITKADTAQVAKAKADISKHATAKDTAAVKAAISKLKDVPDVKALANGKLPASQLTAKATEAGKKMAARADTAAKPLAVNDNKRVKRDTIYLVADTLETQVMTFKALKDLVEKRRLARMVDTSAAAKAKRIAANTKPSKFLSITPPKLPQDTSFLHRDFFGPPKKQVTAPKKQNPKAGGKKQAAVDTTLRAKMKTDSVYMTRKLVLSDTSRIRILFGHHNAKIFKSDFQGKADSIFYSSADSTIRCYVNPMMWSQGSQMSGDTIYLQMKNKKLDNMDIFPKAFVVNTEEGDTAHFNQVAGKKMKGYFADNKLSRMYVDGNAESIYFSRDSGKVDGMERSLASRMRVNFKDNKATDITWLVKPDQKYGPPGKFTEDERILKGFIWKPKDRPESKEAIIPALDKTHKYKRTLQKPPAVPAKPGTKGKQPVLPGAAVRIGKDSTANTPSKPPPLRAPKDSVLNNTIKKQGPQPAKDTIAPKPVTAPSKAPKDTVKRQVQKQ